MKNVKIEKVEEEKEVNGEAKNLTLDITMMVISDGKVKTYIRVDSNYYGYTKYIFKNGKVRLVKNGIYEDAEDEELSNELIFYSNSLKESEDRLKDIIEKIIKERKKLKEKKKIKRKYQINFWFFFYFFKIFLFL